MALGAVVAIAVLAAALLFGPRWYKTLAGEKTEPSKPPEAVQTAPAQPVETPTAVEPTPAPVASEPAMATAPAVGATAPRPRQQARTMREASAPTPSVTPEQRVASTEPVTPPPAAPQAQEKPDPRIEEALGEERERLMLMGTRVAASKESLQKIEHEQSQMGLSLRGDIREASHQVEYYLDEAQAAMAARNVAKAKQNLDKAERSLGIVERFLGR